MKAISKKSALNRMDWFDFLNYIIMLLVIVCTVFPLYYCAIVSISNGAAVTKGEVVFAPVGFDSLRAWWFSSTGGDARGRYRSRTPSYS